MNKVTVSTKAKDIKREWHLVDAKGKVLGRIATEIAQLLMGKRKSYFVGNLDCGDNVVIINADRVEVTGKKESKKKYTNFSGYPGGLRTRTYAEVKKQGVEEIVRHAVAGMLPKNRLRAEMLRRLYIFEGQEHKFEDKFKTN